MLLSKIAEKRKEKSNIAEDVKPLLTPCAHPPLRCTATEHMRERMYGADTLMTHEYSNDSNMCVMGR